MKSILKLALMMAFYLTTAHAQGLSLTGSTNFGSLDLGVIKNQSLTLKNTSNGDLRLDSHWFNETDSYKVTGGTCKFGNWTIKKSKSCTIQITFKPEWAGTHQERFTIGFYPGKTWNWSEATINLTGVGLAPVVIAPPTTPTAPTVMHFVGANDFESLVIGEQAQHIITVRNFESVDVRLDSHWFNNTDSYQVTGGTCLFAGAVLKKGMECTMEVVFAPAWEGSHTDRLTLGFYKGTSWVWNEIHFDVSGVATAATATLPTTPNPTPVSPWLQVVGNKILNGKGERVILKGVNIADPQHLDTKPWERPGVTARSIASLATDEFHAKVIRLPILPGDPNYPTEGFFSPTNGREIYFQKHIAPLVEELTKKGIYVILDLHYISDYGNLYSKVHEFWQFMAPKYKDNPLVIYEIFNEPIYPNNWSTWKSTIAQPIVNLIRTHAPNNLVLVGGPYWSSNILGAATSPVEGTNLAYVAHVYSNQTPAMWDQRYLPVIQKHPVFITEWGFEEGGTEGGDINFGQRFEAWMKQHGLSWTVWTFDNRWGPRMFQNDWTLFDESMGMGTFVRDLLKENQIQIPYAP